MGKEFHIENMVILLRPMPSGSGVRCLGLNLGSTLCCGTVGKSIILCKSVSPSVKSRRQYPYLPQTVIKIKLYNRSKVVSIVWAHIKR